MLAAPLKTHRKIPKWTLVNIGIVIVSLLLAFERVSPDCTPLASADSPCSVGDSATINGALTQEFGTDYGITFAGVPTVDRTVNLPDVDGTVVYVDHTQTVTAKTITTSNFVGGGIDGSILGASDPVTLQGLDLDDLVAGDTLYASGTDALARLGKGSDGEVLTLAAGIPSWAAGGGITAADAVLAVEAETNLELSTKVFINDTTNADMTIGLTINQGASTDEAFALKASNVSHGITSQGETDTFLSILERSVFGGAIVKVLGENSGDINFWLKSYGGSANAEKATTNSPGLITFYVSEQNGSGTLDNINANGNIFSVVARVGGSDLTRWILDEDGDTWQSGAAGYLVGSNPGGDTNTAHVYAKDVSASAEIFVRDEAGNVTQISPHDPTTNHWYFNSCNDFSGRCIQIDMEAALTALGALTGQTLITESFIPVEDRLDWDVVELDKQSKAQTSIAAWDARVAAGDVDGLGDRPESYTPRIKPEWLR